jgi:hypothetical protein
MVLQTVQLEGGTHESQDLITGCQVGWCLLTLIQMFMRNLQIFFSKLLNFVLKIDSPLVC